MACDRIVPAIVKSSIALSPAIISQQSLVIAEGRSPMEVGRRKKEEVVIAMVSAIKNVLTVLAVAISVISIPVAPSVIVDC